MPKYPAPTTLPRRPERTHPFPPLDHVCPPRIRFCAHDFLKHCSELLKDNGEYVDVAGLTAAAPPVGAANWLP